MRSAVLRCAVRAVPLQLDAQMEAYIKREIRNHQLLCGHPAIIQLKQARERGGRRAAGGTAAAAGVPPPALCPRECCRCQALQPWLACA